eukprot:257671-Pleurochrysis_carterae.AAC.1
MLRVNSHAAQTILDRQLPSLGVPLHCAGRASARVADAGHHPVVKPPPVSPHQSSARPEYLRDDS